MPYLSLDSLTKSFGDLRAVETLSLELERGKVLALLGPSGSGKTTTLRLLGGFETPEAGRIVVDGEDVTAHPPQRRRFGMVFQHYALFPHLDVGRNVAFGLETIGVKGAELERRVGEALTLVNLDGLARRRVDQLSGGQQQRVALARALAPEPRVLLLDEPLSNLDPTLRERTRHELRALISRVGITTVLVTHDQEDAFDLGDRVAVLRGGRLEQVAAPDALYREPATPFVAGFIGRSSRIQAILEESAADRVFVRLGKVRLTLPGPRAPLPPGPVLMLARPEAWRMIEPGPGDLQGEVVGRRFTGAQALFAVEVVADLRIEVAADPSAAEIGDRVGLLPGDRGIHLFRGEGA